MHEVNFKEALECILQRDPRFQRDAYLFVREALDFTQKIVLKANKDVIRHVTGQELLAGIRDFALQEYGPMARFVFGQWGVSCCEDFGEIVFNMVEANLLAKTEKDTRDDFKGGYDFHTVFRLPFLPASPSTATPQETESSQP